MTTPEGMRVLVVDDVPAIHQDFHKILCPHEHSARTGELETTLFGAPAKESIAAFRVDSAYNGKDAQQMVAAAADARDPYALAFVDMRMPPGWDGVDTIAHLWARDPDIQVVICSAYSDRDWQEVIRRLGNPDKLLILKKPFEAIEIQQCATALTRKWHIERELRQHVEKMAAKVYERTEALQRTNEQLRGEMKRREHAESELGLVQKLEAVGRLASGIAHEINTPIQYIGDSVYFLSTAFEEIVELVDVQARALSAIPQPGEAQLQAQQYLSSIDLGFLREEIPRAIARTTEGANRVGQIVRAMKEFAHPSVSEKSAADVNHALETTIVMARNEFKYFAAVETDFGDLPPVICNIGELNQVFLNIIVNAAHALGEAGRDASTGRISVSTRREADTVEISIEDNGCGIPNDVIDKIYEPFFTTKGVGRGSGQGLAIARTIVVDKHQGRIDVRSEVGKGTRFTLSLPLVPAAAVS
jgi:two-component system, NtrC family, sensor kinase